MLPFDPPRRLVLPPPISVNNLFGNVPGKGRVITPEYRAWKKLAAERLAVQQCRPTFTVPVEITYFVGEAGVGMMDAGNVDKAATDALVAAKVIHDDSRKWLRSLQIVWTEAMRGIVAVIEPAAPAPVGADIIPTIRPGLRELLR